MDLDDARPTLDEGVPATPIIFHPIPQCTLTLSSRWESSDGGAICSGWAGSSIKFYSHNLLSGVYMRIGHKTQRKDRWNGGTPMLSVSVMSRTQDSRSSADRIQTRTLDAEPGTTVQLWEEPIKDCFVEIVLVDWASILEIDGFMTAHPEGIKPISTVHPQILFIGDSITCGLALERSDGGQPIPRGMLDAFPSQALAMLRETQSYNLCLNVLAYPGILLVGNNVPDVDEFAGSGPSGMVDRFFHSNPWDTTAWSPSGNPEFICIALGTNDEANDVSPDAFRMTLERFIRRLSTTFPSVKAFYVIPPFRDFSETDAGAIHRDLVSRPLAIAELDIRTCVDINSEMAVEHTVDGLHPTVAGHACLAENLVRFLSTHRPLP
ncbi:SGNH hydrolase-type esterase domain-containing protein [Mycena alexandri]|uniref:SGNH hydrolase-type esterase domain-containing protein n=1 Tax=Mycena alexandri TaxID=1745969 RepID=A0AAD6S8W6_9AGAR|nr:SGNH hydrolase-type esterase domain-containing protein [Mycena alexandri]